MTCEICDFIVAHDYLPPGIGSHCSDGPGTGCHATLSSPNYAHCSGCHRSFSGDSAFDAHQGPNGICRDPSTLKREDGSPRFRLSERVGASVWTSVRAGGPYRPGEPESLPKVRSTPRRTQGDAA